MTKQHILLLSISNFKRIEAFHATFDPVGGLTILQGDNEAGKTSALGALIAVATGELPEEPLRRGAKEGEIICQTEQYKLVMRFEAEGKPTFELTDGELKYKSKNARDLWNKFVTSRAFNPLAFATLKDRDMISELLRVCPVEIDLDANAKKAKEQYDLRHLRNQQVKQLEGTLATLPKPPEAMPESVSVVELNEKLDALREQERGHQKKRQELQRAKDSVSYQAQVVEAAKNKVEGLRNLLTEAEEAVVAQVNELDIRHSLVESIAPEAESLPDLLPEANEIKAKLKDAELVNAVAEEARQTANAYENCEAMVEEAREIATEADVDYQATLTARTDALGKAKFPVADLTIDPENNIRLGGTLVQECSTAQKLKLGVEIASASNPTFRAACVDEGSELDKNNMAYLATLCEEHDLRLIVARVEQEPGENVICLVEGKIV